MQKETVLLIPEYSHEIRGSILQVTQRLLRAAAKREDLHLVVPYPMEGSRWKNWTPEKWDVASDNVEFVPVLMDKYSESALGRVSTDWGKSCFGGRKDYYVVATMRSTSSVGIRRLFSKPMVGFYPEVINMYLIGGIDYFKALAADLPDEMLFNFLHSWNVLYGTEGFASLMRKRLRELFVPTVCKNILDKTAHLSLGVDVSRLKTVIPKEKPEGQIRIAYGGRLVAEKGVFDYLEIGKRLYEAGLPIEMGFYFVFDRWGENTEKLAPFQQPYTHVAVNAVPIETNFFAYGASSDLFISTSKHEAAALAFQELLFLGVPGFFLEAEYVKGLVPEGYPYIYKTKSDLYAGVRDFCNRLQKGEAPSYDMRGVPSYIEEQHNRDVCEQRTLDLFVNLSRAKREKQKVGKICQLLPS